MLKRALIVALALMFVLGLSGMALALLPNTSDVDQTGTGNIADVNQHDFDVMSNWSDIDQVGAWNYANVDQHGTGNVNVSYIAQGSSFSDYNDAAVWQEGNGNNNISHVTQYGVGYNIATVHQWGTGKANTSDVTQNGNANFATIDQC